GYAFSLGDVTVGVPSRTGGPLVLRVRPVLDPAAPGPAELPGGPLAEPLPWGLFAAGGVAVFAALAVLLLHRYRRAARVVPPAPVEAPPEPPAPHEIALARIARLREADPRDDDEVQAYHIEASGLVRDYVGERFRVPAAETTEECLSAPHAVRPIEDPQRALLGEVLLHCDLVKFARHRPAAPDRLRMLDAAEGFVVQTTPGEPA
ncbi:MAG: hypothetical protein ACYTDY_08020, partial [Planctomycetota bacterium]